MLGDYGGGVTPVPIPNTEVKPSNADDTASVRCGKVGHCQAFFYLKTATIGGFFIPVHTEHGAKLYAALSRVCLII